MVRIPKASESEGEGFKLPANGTYTAVVIDLGEHHTPSPLRPRA